MSGSFDEDLERCKQRVGTLVRGYRLEALLGVGGMAAVYAASHAGGRVAIKILHAHVAVSKELRARFEQEALAVGRLGHPATVQVHAVSMTDEGAPFMVMELLEGESLGQRAARLGEVPALELLGYVETLLDVLAVAHDKGVIHRDIKPDNLFVTRAGSLKVLDFGIARMREGGQGVHTRTGAMLGTTAYMAPEQIHARPLDGRADLFAVGATMFRVLAKRKLFEAESDAALLMKMGSTQAPPVRDVAPEVDPRVAKIVDRALAFDREDRYPDARAMLADVRAVLRGGEPMFASLAPEVPASGPSFARPPSGHASLEPTSAGAVRAVEVAGVAPPSRGFPLPEPTAAERRAEPSVAARKPSAAERERTTPIALVVALGLVMVAVGSGLAFWLVGGGKDAAAEVSSSRGAASSESAPRTPSTSSGVATASGAPSAATVRRPPPGRPPASTATSTPTALPSVPPLVATPIERPVPTLAPPAAGAILPPGKEKKDKKDKDRGKGDDG